MLIEMEEYNKIKKILALGFIHFLDENRPEGKMCLSNGECAEIEKAFNEQDWQKLTKCLDKYIESEEERIRKAVVHLLEVASEAYLIDATGFKKEQFLSWLEKQKEQKPIKMEVYEVGKGTTICGQDYKCKKDYKEGNCWYIKDVIYHCGRDGYLTDQNGISWSCTPEWFKEYIYSNAELAEKEKSEFVGGQFIQCNCTLDNGLKKGEHYWLEYVGDDTYVGRSDNILNQKFHITPRQLFTLFSQELEEVQGLPQEEKQVPLNYEPPFDENPSDKEIIEALIHHLNEQDDFLTAINCVSTKAILNWLEKQKEQKPRKFKLGDKVHWHDDDTNVITITGFRDDAYLTDSAYGPILFCDEDNWERIEQKPDCVCKDTVEIVPDDKVEEVGARFMRMRETKPTNIGEFLDRLTTVEQEFLWEHIEAVKKLDRKEKQKELPTNEEMLRTLHAEYEKGVADTIAKYEQKDQEIAECDKETETQKAFREGKWAGRQEVFDNPGAYGLEKIDNVFGFRIGDKVRLIDGDGRKHIIKHFEKIEGLHGPDFYRVVFEGNTASDHIIPGDEYPNGYFTCMEKIDGQKEQKPEHFELKAGKWYICHRAFCCRADHLTVKEGERFMCEKDGVVKGFVIKEPEKYFIECSAPAPMEDEQKEQKPAEWSEEDEENLGNLHRLIVICREEKRFIKESEYDKLEEFLKSLRPQPKAELTLLDENIINAAVAFVEQNDHFNVWRGIDKHTVIKALRSLKPYWKPSKEQMEALRRAVNKLAKTDVADSVRLSIMYDNLKKLI